MGSTHLPPTFDPREEPGALAAHAGICAGGEEQSSSLPRPSARTVYLDFRTIQDCPRDLPSRAVVG
jgi:hypothetical protein